MVNRLPRSPSEASNKCSWPHWITYSRRYSAGRLVTRPRWRWDKAGSFTRCEDADEAGRKVKKKKKKDSQGTNEAEREHERVRFSVLALQQKAPGAEPQCSTVADSHPARPIFTLRCGVAGFSLSPRCFLPLLLQVNS